DGFGKGDGGQTCAKTKAILPQTRDGIDYAIYGYFFWDIHISVVERTIRGHRGSPISLVQIVENSIDFCIMSPNVVETKEQSDK
ncbi:MAG: hypothetical protein ACI4TK_12830, partial [Agathobacter sp.]